MSALTMEMIHEAAAFLEGRILTTPVEESPELSKAVGSPVFLKLESLQRTGSFKVRGAYFRLAKLSAAERAVGVGTCSAGNHGKAVAYVARQLGIAATIYVPRNVDEAKYRAMLALGAEVIRSHTPSYDETDEWAQAEVARRGQTFVSAFDDEYVMAANGGSLALEVLAQLPQARSFILPVGGGGLAAGFAYAARAQLADAEIVGSQHAQSPGLTLSLERGEAVTRLPGVDTIAGGLEGGLGQKPFAVLKTRVNRVALVSEEQLRAAVRFMLQAHQYLIEASAAAPVAACLFGKAGTLSGPAVVVLSGRNLSVETLKGILNEC